MSSPNSKVYKVRNVKSFGVFHHSTFIIHHLSKTMDPFSVPTLTTVLGRLLPEPQAGLLAGILFGTKASLSRTLTDAFITTGTIHIIALSGQNVSIVTSLVASSLTHLVSRRIASLLTLLVLGLFLWFVGPSASLVRAVIMGSLTLISTIFGKRNWSFLSLVLAVAMMLLLNPLWITDLGFQLSVLATVGIIMFGGNTTMEGGRSKVVGEDRGLKIEQSNLSSPIHLPRPSSILYYLSSAFWRFVQDDLRLTLSAQLFTTPLIFLHFQRISFVAPITNVFIGWTMPFLMLFGWTAALTGYIWWPLGALPAWGSWVLLTYVIQVVQWTAGFPMASLAW